MTCDAAAPASCRARHIPLTGVLPVTPCVPALSCLPCLARPVGCVGHVARTTERTDSRSLTAFLA